MVRAIRGRKALAGYRRGGNTGRMPDESSVSQDNAFERQEVAISTCEFCRLQVPRDEAVIPEAGPYVVLACGLNCASRWRADWREATSM